MSTKYILDPDTGERLGTHKLYKRTGETGPCIFGRTEWKVGPGAPFRERCLALICKNESPLVDPKNPSKPAWPLRASTGGGVQAYEPWASIGLLHAITKNPNAARLMAHIFAAAPEVRDIVQAAGFDVAKDLFVTTDYPPEREDDAFYADTDGDGEVDEEVVPVLAEHVRSEAFCIAIHKALEHPAALAPQIDFFWNALIMAGMRGGVANRGWLGAAMADERLFAVVASRIINAGTGPRSLLWAAMRRAKAKTAAALTEGLITVYAAGGWGTDRAKKEMQDPLVRDGTAVTGAW